MAGFNSPAAVLVATGRPHMAGLSLAPTLCGRSRLFLRMMQGEDTAMAYRRIDLQTKRVAVNTYAEARARGCLVKDAAHQAGFGVSLILRWTEEFNSETEQSLSPQIAKVRRCLWCGDKFRSSWAGERRCPACRSGRPDALEGLSPQWAESGSV